MSDESSLPFGPLPTGTVHLCIDMQRLFAEDTPWRTEWLPRVLPNVVRLARHRPERAVYTRFIPPEHPEEAEGVWRRYFAHWRDLTGARIDRGLLDLVEPLAELVPPGRVVDKRAYSPFFGTGLAERLRGEGIDTLVISGTETDVCVQAGIFDAMDYGFRLVIARDALCGSADETHDAQLRVLQSRFSQQIEVAPVETILRYWRA